MVLVSNYTLRGASWDCPGSKGPLATKGLGRFLTPEPLPERLLFAEPLRRRMRVRLGDQWIADSEDVLLLHPTSLRTAQRSRTARCSSSGALAERVRPDHVVSTASARTRGTVGDLSPETVLTSFSTKVIGPMLLAKHFVGRMPVDGGESVTA